MQHLPIYRLRLFEARADPSVYLADGNFDIRVFGGVFEIAVAVYRTKK